MAKSANTKKNQTTETKNRLPVTHILGVLLLSALVAVGVYVFMSQFASSTAKKDALSAQQQAITIVNSHFDELTTLSDRISQDPKTKVAHAYPMIIPATGKISNLNFSEEDYLSRARLDPVGTLPEITLSKIPADNQPNAKEVDTQVLAVVKPMSSEDLLYIRWSLNPLKKKLSSTFNADTHMVLYQQDKTSQIKALSIHDDKSHQLANQSLSHAGWSVSVSYDQPKRTVSPIAAGAGSFAAICLPLLLLLSARHRRRQFDSLQRSTHSNAMPKTIDTDTVASSSPATQDAVSSPLPDANSINIDTDHHESSADITSSITKEPETRQQDVADDLPSSSSASDANLPTVSPEQQPNSSHSTEPLLGDVDLITPDTTSDTPADNNQQAHDTQTDEEAERDLFAGLESEIKSDDAIKENNLEFKAPVIPDVGSLTAPAVQTDTTHDAAPDDGNIIEFSASTQTENETRGDIISATDIAADNSLTDTNSLFRTFDVRGKAIAFTPEFISSFAKAFSKLMIEKGQYHLVVGRDVRKSSQSITDLLILSLAEQGMRVVNVGIVTTPLLVFAANRTFGCGIMVTASHCAENFNGFKWLISNTSPSAADVLSLKSIIDDAAYVEPLGKGSIKEQSFNQEYTQAISDDIMLAELPNVIIDCMHGATSLLAPEIIADVGCVVTSLHTNTDGRFTTGEPNPTQKGRLSTLSEQVIKQGADLGIAFDCDGDRMAIVDEAGNPVSSEHIICLFAQIILDTHPASDIVFDIKCSRIVSQTITKLGGRPIVQPTGSHILRQTLTESNQAVFAGELTGHYMFDDGRLGQQDDGVYAALRLLEWLTHTGKPLSAHVSALPSFVATDDLYFPTASHALAVSHVADIVTLCDDAIASATAEDAFYGHAVITKIDGLRLDVDTGSVCIRPSNTSNAITVRISADTPDSLQNIQQHISKVIHSAHPDLADFIADTPL